MPIFGRDWEVYLPTMMAGIGRGVHTLGGRIQKRGRTGKTCIETHVQQAVLWWRHAESREVSSHKMVEASEKRNVQDSWLNAGEASWRGVVGADLRSEPCALWFMSWLNNVRSDNGPCSSSLSFTVNTRALLDKIGRASCRERVF